MPAPPAGGPARGGVRTETGLSTIAEVAVVREREALVARLSGAVDMTNASFVHEEITRAVPNDVAALVLDLSDTAYLDSAAIEVLFELSRRLARRRQRLRLVVPGASPLRRLLTVCDVGAVATMHESLAQALDAA